jgi:ribose 5-phosphate isomerase A
MLSTNQIKQMLGREAANLVQPGMTVGLGSGSTAYWFIIALAERVREGLECRGVPTSKRTEDLAREQQIPLIALDEAVTIDLAVDGADEVSEQLQLIKGGGGALLQEKMVADSSDRFVVIADETKFSRHLGKIPVPVEVIPYGWKHVKKKIEKLGCSNAALRHSNDQVFVTDHGHYIIDCHFGEINYPATLHSKLNNLPGVVDNGLFINLADATLIGHADGTITEYTRQ